ncbi:Platelet-activating factor acetylhydrolase IB subunit beta [Amphibalanus amphitrite]|uniref:Platelet-activating factor acetylhydrolase IB subunit beta n=1 Tax=Amphibalanus amphitrite TaxID=1232801 RepID=A0A6A4WEI4_AMPAM|nr:platelet-activating factor acetylhydrolase IB subunit alpha2-like [Amphibalanus amphitrite]KAF0304393.1 Platelet-activating factor acetylhydrolase IB subunit beta [Amphibalanus amphitrite]
MSAEPTLSEDIQGDSRWMSMHRRFVSEAKEREPDVVFIGDSLIYHLQHSETWRRCFAPLHALNFGIGGDQTQHVLWRITNGEMDSFCPKVVVLLVGTNNFGYPPEQIADGIMANVSAIRRLQPQAFIIVMGLLPRGEKPNALRERNAATNRLLSERLSGLARTQLLADYSELVSADGTLSHQDMTDYLHLSPQGYKKVFEPVYDLILDLLNEKECLDGAAAE